MTPAPSPPSHRPTGHHSPPGPLPPLPRHYPDDPRRFYSNGMPALREPVNGLSHLAGLFAALFGTGFLVQACAPDRLRMLTAGVFGLAMCGCFLASALHHLVSSRRSIELRLWRLDHAAIYPFIAGSFTPVCVHVLPAPGGLWLLAAVWAVALFGMVYKVGFAPDPARLTDPPRKTDTALYVVMGWLPLFQAPQLIAYSQAGTLPLVVLGGLAYSIGALILARRLLDFRPGLLGHHEIWHLCVLLGAGFIYAYVFLNLV